MYSICLRDHEEAVLVSIKFELKYVKARMTFPVPQYVNISSISIKFKKKKKKKGSLFNFIFSCSKEVCITGWSGMPQEKTAHSKSTYNTSESGVGIMRFCPLKIMSDRPAY